MINARFIKIWSQENDCKIPPEDIRGARIDRIGVVFVSTFHSGVRTVFHRCDLRL